MVVLARFVLSYDARQQQSYASIVIIFPVVHSPRSAAISVCRRVDIAADSDPYIDNDTDASTKRKTDGSGTFAAVALRRCVGDTAATGSYSAAR